MNVPLAAQQKQANRSLSCNDPNLIASRVQMVMVSLKLNIFILPGT